MRTLVRQGELRSALLQYSDTIDDDGLVVRDVLGGVFVPAGPPPAPVGDAGNAGPAAELLGLGARLYTAKQAERAGLAEQVIACAEALRK